MDVQEIQTDKDFETLIATGVSLVDFNAPWCGPCKMQEPILGKIAHEFAGRATIAAVNVDENRDLATKLGIRSIPTLIVFKNSEEKTRLVGLQSQQDLARILENESE